jgi:CHAD domain-containing protein
VKARPVEGLDPDGPFVEDARRMAEVRIEELWSFAPQALEFAEQEAQHDMRIAAKRLRYLLEIAGPCFGPPAKEGAKVARKLQDVLGEIHDCDVMTDRIKASDHLGLGALQAHLDERRLLLHRQFVDQWSELERSGFRTRLEQELGVR